MSEPDPEGKNPHTPSHRLQVIMSWVIAIVLSGFGFVALFNLMTFDQAEVGIWNNLIEKQFPVIVGLPIAALGAMFITLVLRISTGPLEFQVAGMSFKGGAAPIVFWVICFLAIVISIKLLWQPEVKVVTEAVTMALL